MSQGLTRVELRQISWPAADVKPNRFLGEEEKKEKKSLKLVAHLPDKLKFHQSYAWLLFQVPNWEWIILINR